MRTPLDKIFAAMKYNSIPGGNNAKGSALMRVPKQLADNKDATFACHADSRREFFKKSLLMLASMSGFSRLNAHTLQASVQPEALLREKQARFLDWKFGLFMHFNMGTFVNREWATGHEDPALFNPRFLDAEQWAKEAKSAGMKYAVLTVKHTGGWCLWPSDYTSTHDMTAFSNYKGGKGDIVRDYVDACRKHGIKVGFYYCLPGDYSTRNGNQEDEARGYKITGKQEDLHGLPPQAKGDFQNFIENQVVELLTKYEDIDIFWFDQISNKYTGKYWQQLKQLVHRLQPNCIVIGNNALDYNETDIHGYEFPYWNTRQKERALPPENNQNPSEVCDKIAGHGWFWNNEKAPDLQSAEDVVSRLELCLNRKSNYLLNVQPDSDGLISGEHLDGLRKVGRLIQERQIL